MFMWFKCSGKSAKPVGGLAARSIGAVSSTFLNQRDAPAAPALSLGGAASPVRQGAQGSWPRPTAAGLRGPGDAQGFTGSRPRSAVGVVPAADFSASSYSDGGASADGDQKVRWTRGISLRTDTPQDSVGLAVVVIALGAVVVSVGVVVLIGVGRMDSRLGAELIGGLLGGGALTSLAGKAVHRSARSRSDTKKSND